MVDCQCVQYAPDKTNRGMRIAVDSIAAHVK